MKDKPRRPLPPLPDFAAVVRHARIKKRLTQKNAAKLLGIPVISLARLETGPKYLPDQEVFWKLVTGLKIDPNELLSAAGYGFDRDCTVEGPER